MEANAVVSCMHVYMSRLRRTHPLYLQVLAQLGLRQDPNSHTKQRFEVSLHTV